MIEAELRSFLTKEKYESLLVFFNKNAKLLKEDYQESHYFDTDEDIRIQKNNYFSKVWAKKGKIHDDAREEIEIKFDRDDFKKLQNIFKLLGHKGKIKWFRNRNKFDWKGITACIDYTKGYGYIIELEKQCENKRLEETLGILRIRLKELGIEPTPRKEFEKRFIDYSKNWKELTK